LKRFILCFDKATSEMLIDLKNCAKNDGNGKVPRARIYLAEIAGDLHKHEYEMGEAKKRLRRWSEQHLGWKKPDPDVGVRQGPRRTKQVVTNEASYHALMRMEEKRLKALKEESECKFYV